MHPRIIAEKTHNARQSLLASLNGIAKMLEIEPVATREHRDPEIRGMWQMEDLAAFAQALRAEIAIQTELEPEADAALPNDEAAEPANKGKRKK